MKEGCNDRGVKLVRGQMIEDKIIDWRIQRAVKWKRGMYNDKWIN